MKTKWALIIIVILALVTVATVSAQVPNPLDPTMDPEPCPENSVSGTVVAVDGETGTVTIDTGEGQLCTVNLGKVSSGHPIAVLLGQFFGNVSADSLKDALDTLEICVGLVEGTWEEVACGENQPNAKVISENQNGSFAVNMDGQIIEILVDQDTANSFKDALEALSVLWDIDEDGTVHQVSEEIEAYHEEGIGFGVLVKLYSIAEENNISVQELVDQFKGGMGWGQIFRQYPKPENLGVGHVRKAEADMNNGDDDGENGDGETPTITKSNGLGRGHGNTPVTPPGLAKKNKDSSTQTTVENSSSDSHPGNGKSPSKDNPGKGNGKGKSKGKP